MVCRLLTADYLKRNACRHPSNLLWDGMACHEILPQRLNADFQRKTRCMASDLCHRDQTQPVKRTIIDAFRAISRMSPASCTVENQC